jgi:hypothetical protein
LGSTWADELSEINPVMMRGFVGTVRRGSSLGLKDQRALKRPKGVEPGRIARASGLCNLSAWTGVSPALQDTAGLLHNVGLML